MFQVHRQVGWPDYGVSIKIVSDSLTKISPLASLGGPLTVRGPPRVAIGPSLTKFTRVLTVPNMKNIVHNFRNVY